MLPLGANSDTSGLIISEVSWKVRPGVIALSIDINADAKAVNLSFSPIPNIFKIARANAVKKLVRSYGMAFNLFWKSLLDITSEANSAKSSFLIPYSVASSG